MDHASFADIYYTGVTNTPDNVVHPTSFDGSCTGVSTARPYATAVIATDQPSAIATCTTVLGGVEPDYGYNYQLNGYSAPANLWLCGFDSFSGTPAACMDHASFADIYFIGAANTPGNIAYPTSFDGSCSPFGIQPNSTAVHASYQAAAAAACEDVLGFSADYTYNYRLNGYVAPTDLWLCGFN